MEKAIRKSMCQARHSPCPAMTNHTQEVNEVYSDGTIVYEPGIAEGKSTGAAQSKFVYYLVFIVESRSLDHSLVFFTIVVP